MEKRWILIKKFGENESGYSPGFHVFHPSCMRTWQSQYDIIGDYSDEGGYRYQLMDRFILQELLARLARLAVLLGGKLTTCE